MDKKNIYTIGGVAVEFPFKPYPSQISMMNHVYFYNLYLLFI